MDDILRRMLEVERQAAQIVTNAEAEAQRLLDEGRQQALAEGQRLRAQLAEETQHLLADRVAQAERDKDAALSTAEERLQTRARVFAGDVRAKVDQVLRELAYPVDAQARPGSGTLETETASGAGNGR